MKRNTWYTAVGLKVDRADGRFYVRCDREEKVLSGMEIQIWSTLLWVFCEEQEIFGRLQGLLAMTFGEESARKKLDETEFWYCLRRLENRGLVTAAEGKTAEEAVEDLMSHACIVRTRYTAADKAKMFLNSLALGKDLRFALRAFKKADLTSEERNLLAMLEQDGRIFFHLKQLEKKVDNPGVMLEGVDREFMAHVKREFLAGVIALYGKKQLMIESIRREEVLEPTG